MSTSPPETFGPNDDFWLRYGIVWHLVAAVNAALVAALIITDAELPPAHRWTGLTALAVLAVWYVLAGSRALAGTNTRWGLVYLTGAMAGFGVLLFASGSAGFLLFTLNPQLFTMVTRWRLRIPLILLLYGELAAANLWHGGLTQKALADTAIWAVAPLVGALLIGSFITGVIRQSRQRADLIEELVRTRAELAAERHEAGVRGERERLAAEIHDTIAQGCTSILMLAQAARVSSRSAGPDAARHLDLIERTARDNLAEARALVAALAPPDLTDRSLADALHRLADRYTHDTGVPVTLTVTGRAASALPDTDLVLLRAAQESLANIRKHAKASSVRIELVRAGGSASVTVTDDGLGFDPATAVGGYGLAGLRGRAAAFGGTCTVDSAPGAGTTVRVDLPDPAVVPEAPGIAEAAAVPGPATVAGPDRSGPAR